MVVSIHTDKETQRILNSFLPDWYDCNYVPR